MYLLFTRILSLLLILLQCTIKNGVKQIVNVLYLTILYFTLLYRVEISISQFIPMTKHFVVGFHDQFR